MDHTMTSAAKSAALYEQTLHGVDQTSGDVASPTGWFAITPDAYGTWYLVKLDTLGFSHAYACRDEAQAQEAFDTLDMAYSEWLAEEMTA